MAIGQRLEEDELSDTALDELYSVLGERDTAHLFQINFTINSQYDIPFGAGNSVDRKTIYIDRGLYQEVMDGEFGAIGLTPEQILTLWAQHEHSEKAIVDGDNPVDNYVPAHRRALRREHELLQIILGPPNLTEQIETIKKYETLIWPGLQRAYAREPKNVPKDLWVTPLLDQPDEDQNEERIKQLAALGVIDARKRSKYETHYSVGSNECHECRNWNTEALVQEAGKLAMCKVVSGLVRDNRHCDFFMYRTAERQFHPTHIGARQAQDGEYYLPDNRRPGKFLQVRWNGRG